MRAVWPDTHVTDDSLVQCISEIRRALGKDGTRLRTVPKQGYRLNTTASGSGGAHGDGATRPRHLPRLAVASALLAALAATAAGVTLQLRSARPSPEPVEEAFGAYDVPTVAVLPFRMLGSDETYFSDGLTQDLIGALARMSGLYVIAPASVLNLRGSGEPIAEIAESIGASHVLEGTVQRAGRRVRVNIHMIEAASGGRLWSQRFDRPLSDILSLQDDLVMRTVAALSVELDAAARAELSRAGSVDPVAYDLFLQGLEHYRRFTAEEITIARSYFKKATERDPGFARAYADLALSHIWEVHLRSVDQAGKRVQEGLAIAKHALSLDADDPYANFAISIALRTLGRNAEAVQAARRVIAINPGGADGYALLAQAYNFGGLPERGRQAMELADRLNPASPFFYTYIRGQTEYVAGNFHEATRILAFAARQNPEFLPTRKLLAASLVAVGRMEDARWEVAEIEVRQNGFSLETERLTMPFTDAALFDAYAARLNAAGLKE